MVRDPEKDIKRATENRATLRELADLALSGKIEPTVLQSRTNGSQQVWIIRPQLEDSRYQRRAPGYAVNSDGQLFTFLRSAEGVPQVTYACPNQGLDLSQIDEMWVGMVAETATENFAQPGYATWASERQTSGILLPSQVQ